MEDPHTLPPMIRLPQVSPHQGRTTLRHFASPARSPLPSATGPAPFPFASPAQVEQESTSASSRDTSTDAPLNTPRRAKPIRIHIPGTLRRELGPRELLLGATVLLAIVIIALVLLYYLTLF